MVGDQGATAAWADRLRGLSREQRQQVLLDAVRSQVALTLGRQPADIDATRTFPDLGIYQEKAAEFRWRLSELAGVALSGTLLFDYPEPAAVARFLGSLLTGEEHTAAPAGPPAAADLGSPIAIVGMACRFPGGASSPQELWDLVASGTDAVTGLPVDRGWDLESLFDPDPDHVGTSYVREGCFLADVAGFDADFFGISPREALAMDPQQRLLLEVSWEALENAGVDPATLRGSATGIFIGSHWQDYLATARLNLPGESEGYLITGSAPSLLSGRLAYFFGCYGPAVTVDTACSSSLVALHQACQALRLGECTMALAGGVAVMSSPEAFVSFARKRVLAPDGRCKAYGRGANGTAWGEGVGLLVVERLADALGHGHPVLALVRGSAVNSDGASNGLTAPNGPAQERVIRQALAAAGLTVADVDAVEGHGTGTRLGDPMEVRALMATYGSGRDRKRPLWLGSVKSNIGHTQAAAGAAGLIKMVKALEHGVLPPTLHAEKPSRHVDWSAGTVRLLTQPVAWPPGGSPRRAGVSAFSVSGTNAHVIVEEARRPASCAPGTADSCREVAAVRSAPGVVPWVVTARSPAALRAQAARLREFTHTGPGREMGAAEVGRSLASCRRVFEHRAVAVGADRRQLAGRLSAVERGEPAAGVVTGVARPGQDRPVFVFPGQGCQWLGMGAELLATSAVFAGEIERCAAALAPYVGWSLTDVLRRARGAPPLDRVDVVQPALFAVMVALAALWRSFGVTPAAVVGHSQGEIAAAYVAGGLSLDDAAKVAALRSKLIAGRLAGRGGMLSVAISPQEASALLERGKRPAEVAAVNSPRSVVVSGPEDVLDELSRECEARQIRAQQIPAYYASHGSQVEEIRGPLLAALGALEPRVPCTPFFSATAGRWLDSAGLDAEYWYRNMRETIRFSDAIRALADSGHGPFIEVSPHPVLTSAVEETLSDTGREAVVAGSLRLFDGGMRRMLLSVAEVFAGGLPVDWAGAFGDPGAVPPGTVAARLPTYPFQHERFWVEARAVSSRPAHHDHRDLGDIWYRIVWKPAAGSGAAAGGISGTWLAVVPAGPAGGSWPSAALAALAAAADDLMTIEVATGAGRGEVAGQIRDAVGGGGTSARQPAGVVSLLALDERPGPVHPGVPVGTSATLVLAQALGDAGVQAPLWLVTRGAVTVGTADVLRRPLQAQVWGLGRVAGLEHPSRWGGLVDLPEALDDSAVRRWLAVLAGPGAEDQVAVRASGVFVRRLVRTRPAGPRGGPRGQPGDGTWRPGGTVLITGGTGVLGGRVARWLAERGAEHVVLASRRGPRAPGIGGLAAELQALGTKVTVAACDVRDAEAVRALLAAVPQAHPLTAVMHLAGVGRLQALAETSEADLAEVMAAKVLGARHLDELTGDLDLDAFVMFSAVSATWGSGRQAAYGAANTFLDALAHDRRARGLAASTVSWGAWAEAGMGVKDASEDALRRRGLPAGAFAEAGLTPQEAAAETFGRWGLRMIAPETMLAALQQVLDAGETSITAVDVDWPRFVTGFTAARPRPLLDDLPDAREALRALQAASTAGAPAAGEMTWRDRLAGLSPQEQDRQLTELVRAHVAAVLGHASAGDIQPQQGLLDAGLDSATAVELRNRLGAATGLRLPATVVLDHPTAADLAVFLRVQLVGAAPSRAESVLADIDRLDEALAGLADGDGDMAAITARLADLARRWRGARQDIAGADAGTNLESATMGEILGILDDELGPGGPDGFAVSRRDGDGG